MPITRRIMLAAMPAAAAAVPGRALAQAQAPTAGPSAETGGPQQAPGFYRYKVGDLEVTAINDGFFRRPLEGFVRNADIGDVKKALEQAFLPQDALPIPFTSLAIRRGERLILIDTGNGDSGAPTTGRWMTNFRAAGFDPARVNTIIISHFHGDHINGLRLKAGTAVFPNAEVMVSEPEWAYWMDDGKMAQAPDPLKANFQNVRRVFGPVAKDVKQYQSGREIAPGITAVAAHGHTPGHNAFVVSSGNAKLIVMSDTTNHPALFVRNPDWAAVFDMNGDEARATRRKLLDMAASERAQVSFYHAPFPATGHIRREANAYEFVPAQWTPAI